MPEGGIQALGRHDSQSSALDSAAPPWTFRIRRANWGKASSDPPIGLTRLSSNTRHVRFPASGQQRFRNGVIGSPSIFRLGPVRLAPLPMTDYPPPPHFSAPAAAPATRRLPRPVRLTPRPGRRPGTPARRVVAAAGGHHRRLLDRCHPELHGGRHRRVGAREWRRLPRRTGSGHPLLRAAERGERGQTVGKMALGIQVRDALSGGPIGPVVPSATWWWGSAPP